ncbi:cytoplasmic dynein 2 light intermediate chain 1 isoform X2 [Planococcus citri]|uniref:cytoplasmic dynein 2 light intermediate chain 1 isoform X2 n=1 Tax=Planococcus citri TaxID=170843 RepID=UPI0031F82D54
MKKPSSLWVAKVVQGKTNVIHQFIEKERGAVESASTFLLEYTYARQSGKSLVKDICHIWELGSNITFANLLDVVAKVKYNHPLSIVLMLDLTYPEIILNTVDVLLKAAKSALLKSLELQQNEVIKRIVVNAEEEDKPYLDPFPVQIAIIGAKYDLFQNMEPAKKRIICQYLRCLAHILQADLLFYSNNDTSLIKKTRDILLHYGFNISIPSSSIVTDYNKPLRIPAGFDSFRNIQGSPAGAINYSLDKYKNSLEAHFNQKTDKQERLPDDPASDLNFEEAAIDNLCQQKSEELKLLKKIIERK